jgi:hypothetical protein
MKCKHEIKTLVEIERPGFLKFTQQDFVAQSGESRVVLSTRQIIRALAWLEKQERAK